MADRYEAVNSQDWRPSKDGEYSLKSLDSAWHGVFLPHLHGVDDVDKIRGSLHKAKKQTFEDELDSRGTFQKAEVRKELRRLNRLELEGRLGISYNKVEDLLDRAERKTVVMDRKNKVQKGEIKYKAFMEVVRDYRLTTEQESTLKNAVRVFAFVEEFSCTPPTFVMVFLTLMELAVFIYTSTYLSTSYSVPITWTGPVPYCSALIYNPSRRWELWRFASYMLVHIGIGHFVFNMIMQVLVGVFLEMEQCGVLGSFKVLLVYMSGVLAGSLGTSLSDPNTYLAGASGGVYALIAAHLATMALNWQEDGQIRIKKVVRKPITKIIRMAFIIILTLHDVGYAIYVRFYDPENRTGFMGHLCGSLAGLTVGLFILDNRRVRGWEPVVQWVSLVIFIGFIAVCIVWNVWGQEWSPGFFPPADESLYEVGKCRDFEYMK
eukprot:GFUD01002970.1.p1 GENE.GFUD01002970.1~~GFUD01002970.1.p1  ORF type:complete len:434 (-),score=114.84 GFUD01002970.1:63-1364(-)